MRKIKAFGLITVIIGWALLAQPMEVHAQENVMVYKVEMYQRPPFYKGEMPLKYHEGKRFLGGGMMGSIDIVYWHDFGSWRNEFSYSSVLILQSAKAVDRNGNLLAEAKHVRIDRDKRVMVFEETHYKPDGSIEFSCTSTFSIGGKVKLNESNVKGKKIHEFFFLLPT